MPFIENPSADDLSEIIHFRVSPLWEFLISLDAAVHTWQFESWTNAVTHEMGEEFLTQYRNTTSHLNRGFYELAVDAPDHNNVESFLHYIRTMSITDFIFYCLGRLIPKENLHLPLDTEFLQEEVERFYKREMCSPPLVAHDSWIQDPEKKRQELLALWEAYYKEFYSRNRNDFSEEYHRKFREWEQILENEGGRALYRHVITSEWFPKPIPIGTAYTRIEIIPIHFLPQRQRSYFGYGKITILITSLHTPEYLQSMQELKNDLIVLLKALGDDSRLEILRLIVESEYDMNGKSLASKLSISPSVVSRHLKQLKSAGIILEKTEDNRNFYYGINRDSVLQINRKLLYYLTERKE